MDTRREAGPGALVDDRYLVKREIARGAMGVVLEAQHRIVGHTVALKTLTAHALDWSGGQERLLREGRALSLCRHPNIVGPLDAGVCDAHGPFLALEMLDGRSLESLLVARRRLSVAQTLRIAHQLCDAVHWAHRHEVVHRDIKPANVIVVHDAQRGEDHLRLVDFGIACVPGHADVVDRKLTGAGEVLGTPEYMAPDQLLDGTPADARSDVYAIGALLYECLFGDVPHAGRPTAIITALIAGTRPRPFSVVRSDVPPELESAIFAALERDPSKRPESAAALFARMAPLDPTAGRSLQLTTEATPIATLRQHMRVPYAAPVRLVRKQGNTDGRTEDVSEGGLLVLADASVENGERMQIKMPLPSSGKVAGIEVVARWCKGMRGRHAIGLALETPSEEILGDIRQYARIMMAGRDLARAPTEWIAAR